MGKRYLMGWLVPRDFGLDDVIVCMCSAPGPPRRSGGLRCARGFGLRFRCCGPGSGRGFPTPCAGQAGHAGKLRRRAAALPERLRGVGRGERLHGGVVHGPGKEVARGVHRRTVGLEHREFAAEQRARRRSVVFMGGCGWRWVWWKAAWRIAEGVPAGTGEADRQRGRQGGLPGRERKTRTWSSLRGCQVRC